MKFVALTIGLLSSIAWAAPLTPTAKAVIPADVRQIINLDYQMLRMFDTAMTLKRQVFPDNLREFESALKGIGVDPDSDLDSLTFASLDDDKLAQHMIAIASGPFSSMSISRQLRSRKLSPLKHGKYDVYPVSKTLVMTSLGEGALLLGDTTGMESVLSMRDRHLPSIDANKDLTELMTPIEKATIWSVLDHKGTERMLLSTVGDDLRLAGLGSVRDKLLGAYFRMNFRDGIRFDMDVVTSDMVSSRALKSLLKLGILYKKVTANSTQKIALDHLSVASRRITEGSERSDLRMQFKADDQQLQILMQSQFFTGMSNERKEFSGFTSADVTDTSKELEHNSAKPE